MAEAEEIIHSVTGTMPVERVPLADTLGRTLGEDIAADIDIPPFDNSAMDGYAVRLADLKGSPAQLPVSQEIQAGQDPDEPLRPGSCARIMTGAPIPSLCDAVVPVEWTEGTDPVTILKIPPEAHAIRRAGEDVHVGQTVLRRGQLITPPIVGMLASAGCSLVPVRSRPSCVVMTTGNELVDHTEKPTGGQIRNSNGPALQAQIVACGGAVSRVMTARDDVSSLQMALGQSFSDDILVLSGGVSVGRYDYVKEVLREMGVDILFWRVLQRPGKPLLFGRRGRTLVFGLPGNPVSSSVCFDRYVRTTIGSMLGRIVTERPRQRARLDGEIRKVRELQYFARGFLTRDVDGKLTVSPTGPQGSGVYSSMALADCIIHLPAGDEAPHPGGVVEVEPLTWWQ